MAYLWVVGHTTVGKRCPAAATAISVLALAGCGGSSAAGGSGHADPLLKLARCMRAHGVSNFPDPSPGDGLILPNGVKINAPAFRSAQSACNKLLPAGLQRGGEASESAKLAMLAIARCMRAHGVPNFSDPTTAPPASPPAHALVLGRGGMFLVVTDPQAPAFRHAAPACHFPLPH